MQNYTLLGVQVSFPKVGVFICPLTKIIRFCFLTGVLKDNYFNAACNLIILLSFIYFA
jgi:hypothetical protein